MNEDVSDPTAWISLVDSSSVPESPCIKIVDIVELVQDSILYMNSPMDPNHRLVSVSDTLYFLFCPDGESFIQFWDVHSCQLVGTIDPQYESTYDAKHLTSDGKTFLVGCEGNDAATSVDLWDVCSTTFIRTLETGTKAFYPSLFTGTSPDGRKLAYAHDHTVHIYNLYTDIQWSSQTRQKSHKVVGWSPNSDHLLTCTFDGNAVVWRLTENGFKSITDVQLNLHYDPWAPSLDRSPEVVFTGDKLIYLDKEGDIIIHPLEDGHLHVRVQRYLALHFAGPRALSLDGQMLALAPHIGSQCTLIDTTSGNVIGGPLGSAGENSLCALCFSADGKQLVGLHGQETICVCDVEAALEQYRATNSKTEANNSSAPKSASEGPSSSVPTAPRNALRAQSNSVGSSILNLPISDVATPSATLSTPTSIPMPYTRRCEERKPIEYDSLLDLPATGSDAPIRPRALAAPLQPPPDSQKSGNSADHPGAVFTAPDHSRRRAALTALWARIRRRRKPSPTPDPRSHGDRSTPIPLRDLSTAPATASSSRSAPAPTEEIVEVAAGRLDDRLVIAPPRKKKKKLPAAPPLSASENEQVQPASQSNASSSSSESSGSSSSLTDSDAESIDWLDYICFCMCCPSNKTKKKKRKEKEGR
ncbi:hypothetical protein BJ138DRAFT_1113030 [Hygrophoropsis aurantiaca]|uniref:Uncharacterized protein n=1 Tax=Hygrophoropsis aurantiaca TaxID=72124 RepID=A0ACB8AEU6_9AGAM|nr:hypothetical protein BJ138DRAFT_1113030 [Hygrophoropsis aurantiaca]